MVSKIVWTSPLSKLRIKNKGTISGKISPIVMFGGGGGGEGTVECLMLCL